MFKQIVVIVLLSILVILCMSYVQQGLQIIVTSQNWIADTLTQVFSGGQAGNLIRKLIALLAIPLCVGFIPVVIYWLAKRQWFPYFMEIVWIIWLAQTAAMVILFKTVA